jgi:serine/threonine protein kinase
MTATSPCPNREKLNRLVSSALSTDDEAALLAHLETCQVCQQQLEQLAGGAETLAALAGQLAVASASEPPPKLAAVMAALQTEAAPSHEPLLAEVSPDLPPGFLQPPREAGHLGRLEHYEVIEEIGRGAMGIVLRAFDEKLHRFVAIKVMSPQLANHATSRRRFVREGHAAAAVCHEHVVTIHSVDEAAGLPYLVMQYVGGVSLQERLDRTGPLEVPEILRIGMQAAAGLAAAHAQGLVHRDIKPANLLLENGVERVKITDFGLARAVDDASLTQSGVIAGTPQYMAPEQARGETIDARADLFSLGCVLYALATGRPPFRGGSSMAVLRRICDDRQRPIRELNPEIPDWLAAIIEKLLAKNPGDRFQSAKELSDLLAQCLAHVQQPSRVPPPLVVLPAPTPVQLASPPASSAESQRRAWLLTPRGIAVLVLAMVAPMIVALLVACIGAVAWWLDNGTLAALVTGQRLPDPAAHLGPLDLGPGTQPAGTGEPAAIVLDAATLAEYEKLIAIAQQQHLVAQERYERGQTARGEVLDAEVGYLQARLRLYRATNQREEIVNLLQQLVAIRELEVKLADERIAAQIAGPSERLIAERLRSEAKLELQSAEAALKASRR